MTNSAAIYIPSDAFEKQYIQNIWRIQDANPHQRAEIILPKGTIEVIFNLSDTIRYVNPALNIEKKLPDCFINGINFKPFQLIKSGQQIFFGIQFTVLGVRSFFDVTTRDLNDNIIDGSLICKSLQSMYQQLFDKNSFDEQVAIVRKWLHKRIASCEPPKIKPQLTNLFFNQDFDDLSVKKLCLAQFISDRQLRRLSEDWLGMNTETFLHYNKYLKSLQLLHSSQESLTQIGLQAGYYDQSHFIRQFKSFSMMTPGDYQKAVKGIPGHIYIS